MSGGEERRRPMKPAEWVSFGVAAVIVLAVVAAILVELTGDRLPPAPTVTVGTAVERSSGFVVPVTLENRGDDTAAEVQVLASLTIDGETTEADQVVDFLAGGESEDLEFVFEDDPADGDLVVVVGGYSLP